MKIALGGLTDTDRAWLAEAGRAYREQMTNTARPVYAPAARLPEYCPCCTCIKRYCNCRCCCQGR